MWGVGVTLAGYSLGKSIHNVDHYLLPIIAVVMVLSLIPVCPGDPEGRREGGKGLVFRVARPSEARSMRADHAYRLRIAR